MTHDPIAPPTDPDEFKRWTEIRKIELEHDKLTLARSPITRFGPFATPIAVVLLTGALTYATTSSQQAAVKAQRDAETARQLETDKRLDRQYAESTRASAIQLFFTVSDKISLSAPDRTRSIAQLFAEYFPTIYPNVHCYIVDHLSTELDPSNAADDAMAQVLNRLPNPPDGDPSRCRNSAQFAARQVAAGPAAPSTPTTPAQPPPAMNQPPTTPAAAAASRESKYRLFIHYASKGDAPAAQIVRARLSDLGYTVPPIQLVQTYNSPGAAIRFYRTSQQADADAIATQLRTILVQNVRISNISPTFPNLPDGIMELWLPDGVTVKP